MSVVIDEVVQETPAEAVLDSRGLSAGGSAPRRDSGLDIHKIEAEMRRRHHRLQRLWAD